MRSARRTDERRPLRHRLCAAVSLVAYLVAVVGFPMPVSAKKAGSTSFPCSGLACGCETAAQCLTCGCSTPKPAPEPVCCCGNPKGDCCCSSSTDQPAHDCCSPPPVTVRWVIGTSAMKCKGAATVWITTGAVVPPPASTGFSPGQPALEWLPVLGDAAVPIPSRPPVPPPRMVVPAV